MAIIDQKEFPFVGYPIKTTIFKQGAQHDKIVFSDAGVDVMNAVVLSTGAALTLTRNTLTAAQAATIAADDQTIAYTGGTANARKAGAYYIQMDDEIVYVGHDSGQAATVGNLTGCIRGALGTTPTTHASTVSIKILNSFNLGDSNTSLCKMVWQAFPEDPRGVLFDF